MSRQLILLPKDDNGVTAGLAALPNVHQWWFECLQRGVIVGGLNPSPWDKNKSGFSVPSRWIDLVEPFTILHQDMYDAFRSWWNNNSMGRDILTMRQYVIQMNEAFKSRSAIVPVGSSKRMRSSKADGQKALWSIKPLLDERASFSRLHKNISFNTTDDQPNQLSHGLTDRGTLPIDVFAGLAGEDYPLSQKLDFLDIQGLSDDDEYPPDPSYVPPKTRQRPN